MCFLLLDLILILAIVCLVFFVLGITAVLTIGSLGYWVLLGIAVFLIIVWALLRFCVDVLCCGRERNAYGNRPGMVGAASYV